jgi:F420-dependent oxidoreductase-like protein
MKIGLQIPDFTWPGGPAEMGSTLKDIACTADDVGFASIWVMDHFFQIGYVGEADEPMLESYSTLGYIAAVTSRTRLGAMVTGVNYRDPGFLVKTVSGLDVLSGGRMWLGIGAGWYEREALGLGLPFPPLAERFERLEETLQIAHQMWSDDLTPYEGRHYRLAEPIISPQPLSQPHPPILIGGGGERKTLRLVAQYADACNLFSHMGIDALAHKLDVLKGHCEAVGRDYDEIERTVLVTLGRGSGGIDTAKLVEDCLSLAEIGVQHAILSSVPDIHTVTPLETIGREVIPAVAAF